MRRIAIGIAAAIMIIADAFIVLGAMSARHGTPDAVLQLSERELRMPPRTEKNAALFLDFYWQAPDAARWLTMTKLDELGAQSARSGLRQTFAALELRPDVPGDGTRLTVIDAALDAATLRARYPDRNRYAILPAMVRQNTRPQRQQFGGPGWVIVERRLVYVPPKYFNVLRAARSYEVTLCLNDNGDLWICGARGATRN